MDRNSDTDVLIVGAGPTGLALQLQLLEAGVRTRLIDQRAEPSPYSRALIVQARTLELLSRYGAAEDLIAQGRPAYALSAYQGQRRFLSLRLDQGEEIASAYPFGLLVSQAATEALLARLCQDRGGQTERRLELKTLVREPEHLTATVHNAERGQDEHIRARFVVGCDGAHSAVRKEAGISFDGAAYPQTFLLGDVQLRADLPRDQVSLFLGERGICAVFPMHPGELARVLVTCGHEVSLAGEDPTLEELTQLAQELTGVTLEMRDPAWLARFRLHHRGVDRYREGRVFLAGDAAHIHSPAGGQGMNTGIQDAWNLGWKLGLVVRGRAPESLLSSYHEERHPVGRRLLRVTDQLFRLASSSGRAAGFVRRFVAPRVAPLIAGVLRGNTARFVSQLGIRYRKSPIVGQAEEGLRVQPGDRLPDVEIFSGKASRWLGHLLREQPAAHHLLCLGSAPSPEAEALAHRYAGLPLALLHLGPGGELGAEALSSALGLSSPGFVLVRPDGHLAYVQRGHEVAPLARYLAQVYTEPVP